MWMKFGWLGKKTFSLGAYLPGSKSLTLLDGKTPYNLNFETQAEVVSILRQTKRLARDWGVGEDEVNS